MSLIERRLEGVHTSMPGQVTRVSGDGSRVDVQPLVRWRHVAEDGSDVLESLPVVTSVPVAYYSGGGFVLTVPVSVGDTVLLVIAESSLDKWLQVGGQADPGDYRRHYFGTGAVALPGLKDFAHKLASVPTDRVGMGVDGGLQVQVTATEIKLGGDLATQPVVNGTTYRAAEDALLSVFAALAAAIGADTVVLPATKAAGAAVAAAMTAFQAAAATYLSTTVKSKP